LALQEGLTVGVAVGLGIQHLIPGDAQLLWPVSISLVKHGDLHKPDTPFGPLHEYGATGHALFTQGPVQSLVFTQILLVQVYSAAFTHFLVS